MFVPLSMVECTEYVVPREHRKKSDLEKCSARQDALERKLFKWLLFAISGRGHWLITNHVHFKTTNQTGTQPLFSTLAEKPL